MRVFLLKLLVLVKSLRCLKNLEFQIEEIKWEEGTTKLAKIVPNEEPPKFVLNLAWIL